MSAQDEGRMVGIPIQRFQELNAAEEELIRVRGVLAQIESELAVYTTAVRPGRVYRGADGNRYYVHGVHLMADVTLAGVSGVGAMSVPVENLETSARGIDPSQILSRGEENLCH